MPINNGSSPAASTGRSSPGEPSVPGPQRTLSPWGGSGTGDPGAPTLPRTPPWTPGL
uniref:Uncharacterized protein n=1 Tax=Sarcophilus harrisii TaxID=9305 RepID=A0A7N4NN12_SARHA